MAADGLDGFEAMLGAFSNLGNEGTGLGDARCPKCGASAFVKVSDLYSDTVNHVAEAGTAASAPGPGGMSEAQILATLGPPRRRSALGRTAVVAIPLAIAVVLVYRRFGGVPAQFAGVAAAVVTLVVFMSTLRRRSDEYHDRRNEWHHLHMCQQCGQLVRG
jgi:hypothetical protein